MAIRRVTGSVGASVDTVFTQKFRDNSWGGRESVSGRGSDVDQTGRVVEGLNLLLQGMAIKSILDVPCGDFHWMRNVNLSSVDYLGGDIVTELVEQNRLKHGRSGIRFERINLIHDALPAVDLVFCRDCLVHLSYDDIFSVLGNIARSSATYLLTTTFTGRKSNCDIRTGQWRPLNLEKAPFCFPHPFLLLNEGCTEAEGEFSDKALGLWRVGDIVGALACR